MRSLLVPMEPAITPVKDVIRKPTAETTLMKSTAVSNLRELCGGVLTLVSTGQLVTSLLMSATMGAFTPRELANTTSQRLSVPEELVVKHSPAYRCIIRIPF